MSRLPEHYRTAEAVKKKGSAKIYEQASKEFGQNLKRIVN